MQRSADSAQTNPSSQPAAPENQAAMGRKNETLLGALQSFERWLESNGASSFDPYDVWGTPYGLHARRLYYRKHPLGLAMIAPLLLLEILFPGWRKAVVEPERFATADAQLLLAFLNLYQISGQSRHLDKARQIGKGLLEHSIPGYSGLCWGYPFDWQNQRGLWRKNTPFITSTPYCYEAFCALGEATDDTDAFISAESIAAFVFHDLRDNPTGANAAAASYSPHDDSQVVNASAYRAMVLFDAAKRFARPEFLEKAEHNLNFICEAQRPDGSWLYAVDDAGKFIDHFHTCFVLKNLFKLRSLQNRHDLSGVIQRGYTFYRRNLFDETGLPKSFAIKPRTGIVHLEMYDFAEAITLGTVLRTEFPEAFRHSRRLAEVLCRDYQLSDGHFVTRIYKGGIRHTFPFLRWPQSQLFLALTNLSVALNQSDRHRAPAVSEEVPAT
jgi:hypothetical protein